MVNWGGIFGRRRRPREYAGEPTGEPTGEPWDMSLPDSDHAPPAGDATRGHVLTGPGAKEVRRMLAMSHDKLGSIPMMGNTVPVIIFDRDEFNNLAIRNRGVSGMDEEPGKQGTITIMTNMNILRDFKGNVFVEVILDFEDGKTLKVLISANRHLSFFKNLASSGMLALATEEYESVITIQLPQQDKAEEALDIIEAGLTPGRDNRDGAVAGI